MSVKGNPRVANSGPEAEGRSRGAEGYRVFKVKEIREELKEFYNSLISSTYAFTSFRENGALPKSALRYRKEWEREWKNVIKTRLSSGKWLRPSSGKAVPRTPPFLLTVRFVMPDGKARGGTDAPVVVDLRKRELRIPCRKVRIPLPERLAKSLEEENRLEPRPVFVAQLTGSGRLRIVAARARGSAPFKVPLRLIAVDENSRHGFAVAVFDFDAEGHCALRCFKIFKPPNHGHREKIAAALRSYADKLSPERRARLAELLPVIPAPEDARELARRTLARKRWLNNAFVERITAAVRKLVRSAKRQDAFVAIVIDPIDAESVKGTPLQGTLLRVRAALKNLARYEGVHFRTIRASGKYCPLCAGEGVEIEPRTYRCPRCSLTWNRDRAALVHLTLKYLRRQFKEECQDADFLRLADALHAWLKRHPKFLVNAPFPEEAGVRHRGPPPKGAQRAGQTVTVNPPQGGRGSSRSPGSAP